MARLLHIQVASATWRWYTGLVVSTPYEHFEARMLFLGGSCNPTTWRTDVAIPLLESAGVEYYNPQVEDWSPELVAIEAAAKEEADVLLFVIDSQTRAIASMLEATEYICTGRHVVLVVEDIPGGDATQEIKDLNRARAYLRDVAQRHNAPMFDTVEEAVNEAAKPCCGCNR